MGAKGGPKTGGRKKGTPNKGKLNAIETLERMGFEPIEEMVSAILIAKEEGDFRTVQDGCSKLLPYAYPRLAQVETHHTGDNSIRLIVENEAPSAGPEG